MKDLSECTVLIVDDTEANIDILMYVLGNDYDIMVAMDGETALEVATAEAPDLILLDIMMPGMDGFEVCERLKADETTKDIPIMFLSAHAEDREQKRALSLGAVDFITKPIDMVEIQEKVKSCLMKTLSGNTGGRNYE